MKSTPWLVQEEELPNTKLAGSYLVSLISLAVFFLYDIFSKYRRVKTQLLVAMDGVTNDSGEQKTVIVLG
jgi:hypothetical protein